MDALWKFCLKFSGVEIEQVQHYKYLGVVFASNGSFGKCAECPWLVVVLKH